MPASIGLDGAGRSIDLCGDIGRRSRLEIRVGGASARVIDNRGPPAWARWTTCSGSTLLEPPREREPPTPPTQHQQRGDPDRRGGPDPAGDPPTHGRDSGGLGSRGGEEGGRRDVRAPCGRPWRRCEGKHGRDGEGEAEQEASEAEALATGAARGKEHVRRRRDLARSRARQGGGSVAVARALGFGLARERDGKAQLTDLARSAGRPAGGGWVRRERGGETAGGGGWG
jgi:hypothetical protein